MKSVLQETQKLPSTHFVKTTWSDILNKQNGKPNDKDHIYYIILRAVVAKYPDSPKDISQRIKAAFPPVTNNNKRILGGRRPYDTPKRLLNVTWYGYFIAPRLGVDDYTHNQVIEMMKKVYHFV
jgi:hypothetical protein